MSKDNAKNPQSREEIDDIDDANVDGNDASTVKGGFNPQPDPPAVIRGFDPQPDPPVFRAPKQIL